MGLDWHLDALIYELHVRTFRDSNGDGIGDFPGLTDRLDYLQDLGVTCLWLLPFYESPLRDDGYDIAHYERIHPAYGTHADFRRFLDAAHARGLRVITELAVNHTSDQHPWFIAARHAPAGSPKRDFYVWSDTADRYPEARIIFSDTESSNWAWDPVAHAFYWHRFFSHQPDLNFDNPHVRQAVLKVMRYWLDQGVDGLRLDAVAHLFEREGTACDNLPETHEFLKQIRRDIDRRYSDRVLLAEVNGSPDTVRKYFGTGDECHMAFHFPLLPRLFLALVRGDARPVMEAIASTHPLPDGCQWATFLRNHDELALSALDDEDRALVLDVCAPDANMRLHGGIRRRLAPLLGNHRARIELALGLLLALPGAPVLYYGDEIGMGDDVRLPDRDGVRTPMQWSDDTHAGFADAHVARLVTPVLEDPVFGYRAVNVASQAARDDSLLSRVRRLIAVGRAHAAFARGSIEFMPTGSDAVLAFTRTYGDETVVVVANLSATVRSIGLVLPAETVGRPLVEIVDDVAFPPADTTPYALSVGPYASLWFACAATAEPA
jgi:maltose alpha-D-glucosyltransferase/alpha-amylase